MHEGIVQQMDAPMEVYRRPINKFVAGFVGSPSMNFFECDLRDGNGGSQLVSGTLIVDLKPSEWSARAGDRLTLGIRPHDILFAAPGEGDVQARIDVIEPLGSELLIHLKLGAGLDGADIRAVVSPESQVAVDQVVGLAFRRDRLHLFDPATTNRVN